jgi:uncharacterized protein (UPF0261 family)
MSLLYPSRLAIDASGEVMSEFTIPVLASSVIASDNASVSSVITLSDFTTTVEVMAIGTPAVVRWVATSDTQASVISAAGSSNYDILIPTNYYRRLVVPIEKVPTQSVLSGGGSNSRNGLYARLAYKSAGIGSVLTAQYR